MSDRFKHRSRDLERLDTGDYTPAEYARWQQEMRFIHGFFGEIRALRRTLLKDIANGSSAVSVLDVGAGPGSLLKRLYQMSPRQSGLFVGLDSEADAVITIREKGFAAVRGDGTRLPFCDDAFDYAYCTLMLHHLAEDAAVELLSEMKRVSSKRLFVVDLNRDRTSYYLYRAIGRLFFQKLTLDDGALSILRSYDRHELAELADASGLTDVRIESSRFGRLILSGI